MGQCLIQAIIHLVSGESMNQSAVNHATNCSVSWPINLFDRKSLTARLVREVCFQVEGTFFI